MSEFAFGLTKTAVEETVSRVKSAIDEETRLKIRVQNDLVFITGEFEMMRSFLNVANKERINNQVVRTWVRQIRDLAFDVENCLEFVLHLDKTSTWSWLWRVLPGCVAPPRPLDEAVAEIKLLKARVEDVSHRNTRYNLIGDSGSHYSNSEPALVPTVSPDAGESAAFRIIREVWEAADKMRRDMGDLAKLITNDGSDLEVISLWGSPASASDLGVIHVISKAYNDPEVCQRFKCRAWVKLMHPFNPDEFLSSLLAQFYPISSQRRGSVPGAEFRRNMREAVAKEDDLMKAQLMQQVSDEQNYLVIVEQLSTGIEWDTIRMYLPETKNGSRIVVTTKQLGLALSCTGNPYQVSDLGQFSNGLSLSAFFSKVSGRRSDMGELIWQLRGGVGVISVQEHPSIRSTDLIDKVYTCITNKSQEFEGVKFERHCWVDVPYSFNLGVFSRNLFLNFHSNDLRAKEIVAAGMMGDTGVIQGCRKFLREESCLIVIKGLNLTGDWDLIKATFLNEPTRCCILVITKEASVARYCVDDAERALNMKELVADVVLRHSIKGYEYYGVGGKEASSRGRFFSNRKKEAHDWTNKFKLTVDPYNINYQDLVNCLHDPGVISLCGIDGAWRSALARKIYYGQMLIACEEYHKPPMRGEDGDHLDFGFKKFSWVDVPHPFDFMDFSWRLFLDFHSDDVKAKQTAAFGMMEKCHNPIAGCLEFLHQNKCLIVIDGLRSTYDWDIIRDTLLSEPTKGCIIVTMDEASVATHCVHHENRVFIGATDLADHVLSTKKKGHSDKDRRSSTFSSRMVEARDWINKFELIEEYSDGWNRRVGLDGSPTPRHGVTSIWGIAGVGKSAPVRRFYYKSMSISSLDLHHPTSTMIGDLEPVRKYSWVDVPEPFNLTDFSRQLIMDFNSDDLEAKEAAAVGMIEGQDPIHECRKFLQEDNYFIVFDGLRSKKDWDSIKSALLSEPIKGSIIVIANETDIARHCVDGEDRVINVKGLDAHSALRLFTKIAHNGIQLTPSEKELPNLIMAKFGGLPKLIAAIGETYKLDTRLLESINSNFMGMLETDPRFHSLQGLFTWMQSYFDGCPDSLKPCIFYLPVFHLGHVTRRRHLLRRWIAEGYSRGTNSSTAEENAENYFSKLVELSIIIQQQQESPSREAVWKVNGFFREYIISRPMEDNLVFALEGRCSHNWRSAGTGQHLTISRSWVRDKIVFESMELSRLRSLTVFGEWMSFFISTNVNMGLLRVLDLENTSGIRDSDIEQIGKLLLRLKFLSLRGLKEITRLPRSLGGLRQLQTLDVKGTSIDMLPAAIIKLQKLQYIRAGTTVPSATKGLQIEEAATADEDHQASTPAVEEAVQTTMPRSSRAGDLVVSCMRLSNKFRCRRGHSGVKVPAAARIGQLTALHTLGVVNITSSGKAILKELKKLTQLHKLGVSGINKKNWHDLCLVISGHAHLESLSIRLKDNEEKRQQQEDACCLDDISELPNTLKSLELYGGNVQVSVGWMKQLCESLTKGRFQDLELTISTQEDIDSLIELPCKDMFRHVCLKPAQGVELHYQRLLALWPREVFQAPVFKILCGGYKVEVVFGGWIPEYVEVLVVHCSTAESSLHLYGLETLKNLKEVLLKGNYCEAVTRQLRQKLAELPEWIKPVLKLED